MQVTTLRIARTAIGVRAGEVARQAGITASMMSRIEAGKSNPRLATKQRLADALGLSIESLFPKDEKPARCRK